LIIVIFIPLLIQVLLAFFTFLVSFSFQKAPTIEEFLAQPIPKEAHGLTGEALVKYVNEKQPFFKAEYRPEVAKHRLGNLMKMEYLEQHREIFDGRKQWSDCPSLTYIRDQSNCGSCWAVSAAETMSDRICVQTLGRVKMIVSDTDILSCCGNFCGYGCNGGYPIRAWQYVQNNGVCTGGRYQEKGVCKPYPFYPCGHHQNQTYYGECPKDHLYRTPACKQYCQYGYGKRYSKDKIRATSAYGVRNDETAIRTEIFNRGPVQASFVVYEDFAHYKSGIYVAAKSKGGHAVKIIGWGVENGTKYWTIANSWNTDWGEDNGYFRMIRGVNNCGIESEIVAGDFRA
ncbi:papain family cysteine protease, partial [Cooperia oncophora]